MPTNLFDKREDDDESVNEDIPEDTDEDDSEATECFDRPSSGRFICTGKV